MNEIDNEKRSKPSKKPVASDAWLNRRGNRAKTYKVIPITPEQVSALITQRERTKVGSAAFIAHFDDIPDGLTAPMIERWANGVSATAPDGFVNYVLDRYQSLPTPPDHVQAPLQAGRILITEDMLQQLENELERTGAPLTHLVRMRSPEAFKLTASKISNWRKRRAVKANRAEWGYVIEALRHMPDRCR